MDKKVQVTTSPVLGETWEPLILELLLIKEQTHLS